MDKNMINIDELVRDRLSGAEEKERTGAWLQTRELLDKKMPVETPPVAFGWKRITGYIAGVVLLAALSVGGYETLTTHGNRQQADNTADNPAAATDGNNTVATTRSGNTTANDNANGIGGNPNSTTLNNYSQDNNTVRPANNNRNSNTNRNHTAAAASNGAGRAGHDLAANTVPGAGNTSGIAKSGHIAGPNNTAAGNSTAGNYVAANTASGNRSTDVSGNNSGAANIGSSAGNIVKNNTANTTHSVAPRNPEATQRRHAGATVPAGIAANANTGNSPGTAATPNLNNNRSGSNTGANTDNTPDNKVATAPVLKKDTIEKIRLVQQYNRKRNAGGTSFHMDTIGVEQMIVNRPAEPVVTSAAANTNTPSLSTARHAAAAQKNPATFTMASANAAKAGLEADANSNLVPLSNYRVASHKVTWDPQRFEEAVARFKYKLAQLKFYPGMVAGINASMFGPNSFGGFQLGLSSTVAFNDHLSLAAELKYISRFNSGVTVADDYAGKPSDSVAIYNPQGTALEYMSYSRDSVHHYFNFSMLHSIELPVSVKYSLGRFFMMGGLNFAYHIKVDAEEIERHMVTQTVVPYNHAPITWPEGKPSMSSKDFNSRFALGGLLGIGYEMTPAVQLDLRMTKSFWDNARGNGAKSVSDQLYRSPSLQLSIGYRFSQQKH